MTVDVTLEQTQQQNMVVSEENAQIITKNDEKLSEKTREDDDIPNPAMVEKSSSYREESNYLSDLKEPERIALAEMKSRLEEVILGNTLFSKPDESDENQKKDEKNEVIDERKTEGETEEKTEENLESKNGVNEEVSIWGVELLPSKNSEGLDVVLLKFLRAREFKVSEAIEMLKKTLIWREDLKIGEILEEELGVGIENVAYMKGLDREKHPVCYNKFGVFSNEELYKKVFGSEEKREKFLRWRYQFMEKGIKKLDFRVCGVSSILQVYDLKNCPGIIKKDIRNVTFKAIQILQDNYPELVAKNVLINVPFWYYAFYSLISPFLTQRSKSKFVVARPAKVTETLLKYIPFEEIPIEYGGFKRDDDFEFELAEDVQVSEIILKPGSTETIEIPAIEVGKTLVWDFGVLGGEVSYKEEFIPSDEGSYTIIIHKEKKMECLDKPVRNSFVNNEVGKLVLTINNPSKKKKRAFFRYKN